MTSPQPPSGPDASRLRRRLRTLLARFQMPDSALPGALAVSYRRCGKPSCHCAQDDGHPLWTLTFMAGRKKRVETIPPEWVECIRPRVQAGRKFKDTAAELLLINAELLVLSRKQRTRSSHRSSSKPDD
jgi:hypothetical protein